MSRATRFIRTVQAQQSKRELRLVIGSSNTCIAIGEKIVFNQPTCLAVHLRSGELVAIGHKAYQMLGKTSEQLTVIFPVQNGVVASSRFLKLFLQAIQRELGLDVSLLPFMSQQRVLMAVPDTLSPVEQTSMYKDLQQVQWGKLQLYSKALACATALDRKNSNGSPICVVSIAGMATEIAIISNDEVIAAQRFLLGGLNFTEAVQMVVRATHQCAISWHTAETVKQTIGCIPAEILSRTIKQKKMSVQGKDIATQLGKTVVVEAMSFSTEFLTLAEDLLLNIQTFFSRLPTDVSTSVLTSGILLSGGAARMPGLSDFLGENLHVEVSLSDTPDLDIIHGLMKTQME